MMFCGAAASGGNKADISLNDGKKLSFGDISAFFCSKHT